MNNAENEVRNLTKILPILYLGVFVIAAINRIGEMTGAVGGVPASLDVLIIVMSLYLGLQLLRTYTSLHRIERENTELHNIVNRLTNIPRVLEMFTRLGVMIWLIIFAESGSLSGFPIINWILHLIGYDSSKGISEVSVFLMAMTIGAVVLYVLLLFWDLSVSFVKHKISVDDRKILHRGFIDHLGGLAVWIVTGIIMIISKNKITDFTVIMLLLLGATLTASVHMWRMDYFIKEIKFVLFDNIGYSFKRNI